jgi:hypothetical protein
MTPWTSRGSWAGKAMVHGDERGTDVTYRYCVRTGSDKSLDHSACGKSHRTRLPPRQFQTQLLASAGIAASREFWLADGRCSSRGDRKAPGSINVTTHTHTSIALDPLAPERWNQGGQNTRTPQKYRASPEATKSEEMDTSKFLALLGTVPYSVQRGHEEIKPLPLFDRRSPVPAPKRVAGCRIRREPSFLILWVSSLEGCHRLGCNSFPSSKHPRNKKGMRCFQGAVRWRARPPCTHSEVDHRRSTSLAQKTPTVTSLVGNAATSRPPHHIETPWSDCCQHIAHQPVTLWVWDGKETGRRALEGRTNPYRVATVPSRIPLENEASHELLGGLHHDEGGSLPVH